MRSLVFQVTLRRSGARARRGDHRDAEWLTVGRGTDNVVQVPGLTVALHHCVFRARPDGVFVEPIDALDLRVNGSVTQGRIVAAGDVIRVGQHEIRILDVGSSQEDVVLQIEEIAQSGDGSIRARTRIGIERGWLRRRVLSWALGLGVLLVALGIPVLDHQRSPELDSRASSARPAAENPLAAAARLVAASASSGPLSRGHARLGEDCAACHAVAFEPVRDRECRACHGSVAPHGTSEAAAVSGERCASCHLEHDGDEGLLRARAARCRSCHGDLATAAVKSASARVASFSADHPELRPRRPERPPITFSHGLHLEPGLAAGSGEAVDLACADCHGAEKSEAFPQPIEFERHCRDCHGLEFDRDVAEPAPHRGPPAVRTALFAAYSAAAVGGATPARTPRRGGPPPFADGAELRAWVLQKSAAAERRLLGPTGTCASCHGERLPSDRLTEARPGASRWLPRAAFDHEPHRTAACTSCHDVSAGGEARAGIPGIDRCRDCHGDAGESGLVPSPCILCHHFHATRAAGEALESPTGSTEEAVVEVKGESSPPAEPETAAAEPAQPTRIPQPASPLVRTSRITAGATLYAAPADSAMVLGDFEGRTEVTVVEERDGFARVFAPVLPTGSVEGWVRTSALTDLQAGR